MFKMFKNRYILVFCDRLIRYSEIVAIADRKATTIAQCLTERIIMNHSCPLTLLSDNAAKFTSQIIKESCKLLGISKVQIVPYHPAANGLTERMNSKILSVLRHCIDAAICRFHWRSTLHA